jgi:hypothetical protein
VARRVYVSIEAIGMRLSITCDAVDPELIIDPQSVCSPIELGCRRDRIEISIAHGTLG